MSEGIEREARLPDSELRAWILTAEIFHPGQFNLGQPLELFVIRIEGLRAWTDEAILAEVELMDKEGLVRKEHGAYRSTYEGQVARERLLQAEGHRAACLLHQHDHDVQDLVLALVVAPQVMGRIQDAEAEDALKVYLHARAPELRSAANALIENGYMTAVENLGFSEESPGYYPSGKGMRRYDEFVRERLGIAKNTSILDPSALADEEPGTTTSNSDLAIADSVLNIGEVVTSGEDTYRILAQVGAGGMGRVYSAERPDGRRVALKVLSSTRFEIGATERERFRREARIARDVDHLNLVRAFAVFEHRGLLVTVMELLPGENLEVRLKKGRPAIDVGLRWMLELAAGLGELHAKRIVHRDISAKNALLRSDNTLAISDFGIARPVDDPTLTVGPGLFGSLIYISPQQRENPHDSTFADDVFSLGQLFFYIVTGMNPHNTGALSQHTHVYEQRVVDLIESMRHHDRTKRPVDGNDVRFRLEACVKERATRRSGAAAAVPGSPRVARLRAAAITSLPDPEPVPALKEVAPQTPDELLVHLANQGNGSNIGHVRFGRDDLRALVRMPELELADMIKILESRGLVYVARSLGHSLPLETRLTHTGREAAHKSGASVPSPVSDADELRQQMRQATPRDELSGSQLAKLTGWPVERVTDAALVLADRGDAQIRQKSAPDGFRAELTAEGRLA